MEQNVNINNIAELFKLFSNPIRLKVILFLGESNKERSVKEISEKIGVSALTLSPHLARLRRLKMVSDERKEGEAFYRLTDRETMLRAYQAVLDFYKKQK